MDQLPIEDFQREQAGRIAQSIQTQSGQHLQKIQQVQHSQWMVAHQYLAAILRLLDNDFDEASLKGNTPLESLPDDDLSYLIQIRIRKILAARTENPPALEYKKMKQQWIEAIEKIQDLEHQIHNLKESNREQVQKSRDMESHLIALRQVNELVNHSPIIKIMPTPSELFEIPEWFYGWKSSRQFEKTSAIVLSMGNTGQALRPSILKAVAARLAVAETNRGLDEAINQLISPADDLYPRLVEEIPTNLIHGSSSGGNPPMVLSLTRQGELAFEAIIGQKPKANEYLELLRHHSSPGHTVLNIQASEFLVEEGYLIQARASQIQLVNGEVYIPDIIAKSPSSNEILLIEVECDVNKDQEIRKRKWLKAYEATGGNIYVFCDNLSSQRKIQAEMNLALGELGYTSSLTNLHGLRQGKRSVRDSSIWISRRSTHSL